MVAEMAARGSNAPSTNSRQSDVTARSVFKVIEVGIDTVSYVWRPRGPQLWAFLTRAGQARELVIDDPFAMPVIGGDDEVPRAELLQVRRRDGRAIQTYRTKGYIAGVHWTFDLFNRVIWCEGRLACILDDDPAAVGLRTPGAMERGALIATILLASYGVDLDPNAALVRRCDITGRVGFGEPTIGQAMQRGLRDFAEGLPKSYGTGPVVETVEWSGRRNRTDFRSYDDGVHRTAQSPGALIRLERQLQYDKPNQVPISEFLAQDLGGLWLDDFDRRTVAVPPLGGPEDARMVIEQQIADGTLSVQAGTTLQGSIDRLEHGGYALWGSAKLQQDHRRRLTRALARYGVETIAAEHRRGDPWPTVAFCRPAGSVLHVADVSRHLRQTMTELRVSERLAKPLTPALPRLNPPTAHVRS
jgi:hypothetical protein